MTEKQIILKYDEEKLSENERRHFDAVENPENHDRFRSLIGGLREMGSTDAEEFLELKIEKL